MSIFNIICNNINVKFDNEFTYENFIGQFQKHSDKILCIINSKSLHIYDKNDKHPELLKFEYTKKHNDINEFYFKNKNNDLYCFFGQEALTFLNINDINLYNESQITKPKNDLSQIKQSKNDLMQIEKLQIEQSKNDMINFNKSINKQSINKQSFNKSINNQSINKSINNQSFNNQSINKSINNQSFNNQSINKQSFNNQSINKQSINNDIKSINIDNIKYVNIKDRISPNIITIIDKGEKLLFPNYDYEINITEFD
jgi:hypothetical protein